MKPRQLTLFEVPSLPSRPFPRWSRKFNEVAICSGCGRTIITQRRTANGEVISEYVSADGECFECDRSGKR